MTDGLFGRLIGEAVQFQLAELEQMIMYPNGSLAKNNLESTPPIAVNINGEDASASPTSGLLGVSGESGLSSRQLWTAITELVTALSSTLNDERDSAEECLSRAAAILQPPHKPDESGTQAEEQGKGGLAPWQVRKVTSYIGTNLDKPIKSRDLAALLSLTPCHFSRAFRNSFGDSPLEYVIRRRIERAQGLMLSTDAPLSQIALDCGLADQAHFSRLFRRIVGETPRAWRRARISPCARDPLAGVPVNQRYVHRHDRAQQSARSSASIAHTRSPSRPVRTHLGQFGGNSTSRFGVT